MRPGSWYIYIIQYILSKMSKSGVLVYHIYIQILVFVVHPGTLAISIMSTSSTHVEQAECKKRTFLCNLLKVVFTL